MEEAQIMERMNKKFNRFSLAEDMHRPIPTLAKQDAAKMTSPPCNYYKKDFSFLDLSLF